jgi:hypothetical protein
MKVLFWPGVNDTRSSEIDLTMGISDCSPVHGRCSLDRFAARSEPFRPVNQEVGP